jgi:hypothetical protein
MVTLLTSFSSGKGPATALTPHESLTKFDIAQSPNALTKFLKPRLKARFLKKFDLFVMSSSLEARDSLPADIAASPRNAVISHPVYDDISHTLSARTTTFSDTPLRLGCLGRLHQKKNLSLLIEALPKLDANVSLTIAGIGPEEEALKTKAGALGVGSRINWLGFIQTRKHFLKKLMSLSCHLNMSVLVWQPPKPSSMGSPPLSPANLASPKSSKATGADRLLSLSLTKLSQRLKGFWSNPATAMLFLDKPYNAPSRLYPSKNMARRQQRLIRN